MVFINPQEKNVNYSTFSETQQNNDFKNREQDFPHSIHIIAEFSKCKKDHLVKASDGEEILKEVIKSSDLHCVYICSHQFQPMGYTAAALLTESHITLHTWPEHDSLQLDIFTCGSHDNAKKAYALLKSEFTPGCVVDRTFIRTLDNIKSEKL